MNGLLLAASMALAPIMVSVQVTGKPCRTFPRDYMVSPPLSVKEVEDVEMRKTVAMLKMREDMPKLPFGFQHEAWTAFKSRMRKGDKLVEFSSDKQSWQDLAGEAGYAIVRSGCIVDRMTTMIN